MFLKRLSLWIKL